ncbi:MAG: hypothetical protein Q9181_003788 [Wetmoreana brouardii]
MQPLTRLARQPFTGSRRLGPFSSLRGTKAAMSTGTAETDTQAANVANSSGITASSLQNTLREKLEAEHVNIEDMSGLEDCLIRVVEDKLERQAFAPIPLLQQLPALAHRAGNYPTNYWPLMTPSKPELTEYGKNMICPFFLMGFRKTPDGSPGPRKPMAV